MSKKFNFFQVAGIYKNEEVHTSIIAELIKTESKTKHHKHGDHFLKLLLDELSKKPNLFMLDPADFIGAVVETEVPTLNGRRIDMVISTEKYYIPFEVKIWAKDQNEQLADYYNYADANGKEKPYVFFLTPNGDPPHENSTKGLAEGDKDKIKLISFKEDILPWLIRCKEVCSDPDSDDVRIMIDQLFTNIKEQIYTVNN